MKKIIILATAVAAGLLTAAFAENGMWLPALIGIGWNVFLLIANARKMPRAATRSTRKVETKILDFYSTTVTFGTQTKVWTPAGKVLMPIHYEE